MSPLTSSTPQPAAVVYPDSDGQPVADNTEQMDFIILVKSNLDALLPDFVAGDHLWYPVEGDPKTRVAPDVYVALGRPKGHRGSYKQWEEAGVAPQVVFEWWSPGNGFVEQLRKLQFYSDHGVVEYFTFDQLRRSLGAFRRTPTGLEPVPVEGGVESSLLGVRFDCINGDFKAWDAEGNPFLTVSELKERVARSESARQEAESARQEAESALRRAQAEAAVLRDKLVALGLDPASLS